MQHFRLFFADTVKIMSTNHTSVTRVDSPNAQKPTKPTNILIFLTIVRCYFRPFLLFSTFVRSDTRFNFSNGYTDRGQAVIKLK